MESEKSNPICKGCKKSLDKVSILKHFTYPKNINCKDSYSSEELIAFQNEADLREKQKRLERKKIKRRTDNPSLVADDTRSICKVCQRSFKNLYMHLERGKQGCKDNYCQEDLTTLENDRQRKRVASKRAWSSSQSEPDRKKRRSNEYLANKLNQEMKPMSHHLWCFLKKDKIHLSFHASVATN